MHNFLCSQRNGVEVTVLEARDRVGGRVHTLRDAGFACPVDLGASLITGTQVHLGLSSPIPLTDEHAPQSLLWMSRSPIPLMDEHAALRLPLLVARQFGLPFHALGDSLPLFDGVTQYATNKQ